MKMKFMKVLSKVTFIIGFFLDAVSFLDDVTIVRMISAMIVLLIIFVGVLRCKEPVSDEDSVEIMDMLIMATMTYGAIAFHNGYIERIVAFLLFVLFNFFKYMLHKRDTV